MISKVARIVLFVVIASVSTDAQPSRSVPVQGVWRVVEQTINDRTLVGEKLGAGFHIYTAGYYAAVRESGVPPRPDVRDIDKATASELLAVYGPFVAQLGTYKVVGDRLILTALVEKNPSNMAGRSEQRRFRIEGNTLITEPVERVQGNRQITLKMVRVE